MNKDKEQEQEQLKEIEYVVYNGKTLGSDYGLVVEQSDDLVLIQKKMRKLKVSNLFIMYFAITSSSGSFRITYGFI